MTIWKRLRGIGLLLTLGLFACEQPSGPRQIPSVADTSKDTLKAPVTVHPERDSVCRINSNAVWLGTFEERLVFHPDMTYEWTLDESKIACERGKVSVDSAGNLQLACTQTCDAGEGRSNLILGNAFCLCTTQTDNAEYRETMRCSSSGRSSSFGNANALTQAGDQVTLWGLPCVVVRRKGRATRSVNVRSAPSADSATVVIDDPTTGLTREELLADQVVDILAKTQRTYMVGKWESPWYYVKVNALTGNVWVFGRYLKEE